MAFTCQSFVGLVPVVDTDVLGSLRREIYRLAIGRLLRGISKASSGRAAVCLDVGDGSTCAFLAAGEGAGTVVSYEPEEWSHLLVGQASYCICSRSFLYAALRGARGLTGAETKTQEIVWLLGVFVFSVVTSYVQMRSFCWIA